MIEEPQVKIRIQRWIVFLVLAGALLLLASVPSFPQVSGFLGRMEPDGSFDSLTRPVFEKLVLLLRSLGGFQFTLAVLLALLRKYSLPRLVRLSQHTRPIHMGEDLQQLWHSIYSDPSDRTFLLAVALIALLAALVRLIQLRRPVDYDEAYTYVYFASRPLRYIVTDYSGPNNHIFHTILVRASTQMFGNSLATLRLPAFLAGVFLIPAGYLAGKSLYNRWSGLLAAAGLALWPMLVDYSVNARGYTLVCLFACLGIWLAAELTRRNNFTAWLLLACSCSLGMYSIPTFLYPFGVIFLYLFLSALAGDSGGITKIDFLWRWCLWGSATVLSTLLLYSPVLILGTGLNSIINNEFVQPIPLSLLREGVLSRFSKVWSEWMNGIPAWLIVITGVGFFLSILLHSRMTDRRIPLPLPALLWIALAILIQRVVPLARVWLFLLAFYLIWSAAGVVMAARLLTARIRIPAIVSPVAAGMLVISVLSVYISILNHPRTDQSDPGIDYSAATYLEAHLTDQDTVLAVAPGSIRVGYYLLQKDIPYSRFYDRARPVSISQGYILVIERSKYATPESILTFHHLEKEITPEEFTLVFKQKRMAIYRFENQP